MRQFFQPPGKMAQMSVTQGLAELKLLDKRLTKALKGAGDWVIAGKGAAALQEEHKKATLAEYQSYMDLVKRRDMIKRQIIMSNATTQVRIGEWTGSVAEAIEYKTSLLYKKKLLGKMKESVLAADEVYESDKKDVESRLDRLLTSELGKDVKTNPATIATLSETFLETNKVLLLDPLCLKQSKCRALEDEIDAFETNVDWVLSEANGKTLINV